MTEIVSSSPPASENDILALERALGRAIPNSYRGFLKRHDGGKPKPDGFEFRDENGQLTTAGVTTFLSARDGDGSVAECLRTYSSRIPVDALPIAHDGGGNLLLLAMKGPHEGKVLFWDHNFEAEAPEQVDYRNTRLVAESFDAFLAGLRDFA